MRYMLKSKIHRAIVTDSDLHYEGSITLDTLLMEAADIRPYERLEVLNINNGARFQTYAIQAGRGSGTVCVNGAAARLVQKGDPLIVLSYSLVAEEELDAFDTSIVFVDEANRITGKS